MSIAPLAVFGIAKAAFSLVGALADSARRPAADPAATAAQQASAQESVWHWIGREVDVRSLNQEELAKVSWMLYDNGAIGLSDHATLSFDGSSGLLTGADASGRVDWVAEFQARLARHQAEGDAQSAARDRSALDILARLQAGSRGVTSVRV
jgi:hypothetical protein